MKQETVLDLSDKLFKRLVPLFPIIKESSKSFGRLYEKVVIPAVELSVKMHTSSTKYNITPLNPNIGHYESLTMGLISKFSWIDIETRKPVKENSGVLADRQGTVGKIIMHVEPVMMRINKQGTETRLRNPTYVIELS